MTTPSALSTPAFSEAAFSPPHIGETSQDIIRSAQLERECLEHARRLVTGHVTAFIGSLNILLGAVTRDHRRTAYGHRQRVIGTLQINCDVDRQTANAFVDRWMTKHRHVPLKIVR